MPSKIVLQQTWVGERGSLQQQQQGPLVRAESTSTVVSLGVPSREEVEFAQRDYLKVSSTRHAFTSGVVFTHLLYIWTLFNISHTESDSPTFHVHSVHTCY